MENNWNHRYPPYLFLLRVEIGRAGVNYHHGCYASAWRLEKQINCEHTIAAIVAPPLSQIVNVLIYTS